MNNFIKLDSAAEHSKRERLDVLCKWIDANLDRRIDWTELVEASGMGHIELQNQFSTHFKTSPMQWIRVRRQINASNIKKYTQPSVPLPMSLLSK
jgi:transcriptional regulator GlxA family with amidase domain